MTTSEFIAKSYRTIENGELAKGKCSSVFADGTAIYSYGYHYPLLFTIESESGARLWVRNTRGYSSTTSKHICWAGSHADIDAELPRGTYYGNGIHERTSNRETVQKALQSELEQLTNEMQSKTRKNTQVYARLETRHNEIVDALKLLAE